MSKRMRGTLAVLVLLIVILASIGVGGSTASGPVTSPALPTFADSRAGEMLKDALVRAQDRTVVAAEIPASSVEPAQLSELQAQVGGTAGVAYHAYTGKVRFLSTQVGRPIPRAEGLPPDAEPEAAARAFLADYGTLFGLSDPAQELSVMRQQELDGGRAFVRFQQVREGIPILGGELIVQSDAAGNIVSANGEMLPTPDISVNPRISADQAAQTAVALTAVAHGLSPDALVASQPELWIYNPILLGANGPRLTLLTWRIEVQSASLASIRELVLVDAQAGLVVLHFDQVNTAKNRKVYDNNNNRAAGLPGNGPVRTEGQGATGIADVDLAYEYSGDTYDFYKNNFGRDSLDGAGMAMILTVRYCKQDPNLPCPFPNAFWNGTQMAFGQGFTAADDVVAHELTHAVTQYESNLFYYMQSGAINEALSDIFGEFVDLTNGKGNDAADKRWLMGEDLSVGAGRSMSNPPAFNQPDKMTSSLYRCTPVVDDQGGVHSNSGVGNKTAFLMTDGGTFNGRTVTGLGIPKSARIWYRVQANLLTSAADYQDLYNALQQACTDLIGTAGITASDCQQVRTAVEATELNLQPTQCQVPHAPICDGGQAPTDVFFDDLENPGAGRWQSGATVGESVWIYPYPANASSYIYATSGQNNIWGVDNWNVSDSFIRMTSDVRIPTGSTPYLHFNHAWSFEYFGGTANDGGVLEYSTNGGSTWNNTANLFTHNGYNATIVSGSGNPLAGQRGFAGESMGYTSSRLNLSSLAGQNVRFRFRVGTNATKGLDTGFLGWFIDDIRIYTCGSGPVPTATQTLLPGTPDPGPSGTLMTQGFEGDWPASGWQISGSSSAGNNAYLLGKRNCHPHTGSFAGWTVGGGAQGSALSCSANYPNNVSTWAIYGPFDLSNATSAELSFYVWGKAEPPDNGYCYDELFWGSATANDFSDFEGVGTCADATGGSAGNGYYRVTLDLTQRLGAPQVWIALGFYSDESVNDIGYTLDDLTLAVGGGNVPGPTPTVTRTPMSSTATPTATRTPMPPPTGISTYTISGRVTASGAGLAAVMISDGAGHSATTDASGAYTLSGLAAGSYTLTPTKSGCTFTPASRPVAVPPSAAAQDFTANCSTPPGPNMVVNGDFEQGRGVGWAESSLQGRQLVTTGAAHGGTWLAQLGDGATGTGGESAQIYQTVTIPTGSASLTYWYKITAVGPCVYSHVAVLLGTQTLKEYQLCATTATNGWVQETVNLAPYVGQTLVLRFFVETMFGGGTTFYVDDIVVSQGAPVPPPTPEPPDSIVNGDFESGPSVGWSRSSTVGLPLISQGPAHGGLWRAVLGNSSFESAAIAQTVRVPAAGATLEYWYMISSEDVCANDRGFVYVSTDPSGANLTELKRYVMCTSSATGSYLQDQVSLAAYAGQTVSVSFRAVTDGTHQSTFYVDDVVMRTGGVTTYTIAGQVTIAAGAALPGVAISDGAGHSATTGASGAYTLSGLAAGSYTLTPTKSGCTFTPASLSATLPPNATGKNFTATCSGGGGVRLYLDPGTVTQSINQVFTLALKVDLGSATADTVDAYFNFDPTFLEVVDAAGNPATVIEVNTAVFSSTTMNSANNSTGQINFSAYKYDSPHLTGSFTAATLRFKAKATVANTSVSLVRSGARWSDILRAGDSLSPTLTGSTVTINSSMSLNGRVALERRGAAGNSRWVTQLYRDTGGAATGGIEVYQAGTNTLLGTFSATTDANGGFTATLTGLGAGVYDIKVKGGDTLSNKKLGVSLPSGEINFGTLLVGDSNGNDNVNGGDVSYMVPSFLLSSGDPGYRVYADTNKDGSVNGGDVSSLIPNFLKAGPLPVGSPAYTANTDGADRNLHSAAGASLALSPASGLVQVGDIFAVEITANTGTGSVDTVDAYINFDPNTLEVVNASGQPTGSIELNQAVFTTATFNSVNNATGQIAFSASKYDLPYLTGTFRAATIRFKAKAAAASTNLMFVRNGARWSDLLQFGESLDPILGNGSVQINPAGGQEYSVYLPFIQR